MRWGTYPSRLDEKPVKEPYQNFRWSSTVGMCLGFLAFVMLVLIMLSGVVHLGCLVRFSWGPPKSRVLCQLKLGLSPGGSL